MSGLSEKSTLPLSMIFTLLGGAFTIAATLVGVYLMQDKRSSAMETQMAFLVRDVTEIKAQVREVKDTMREQVSVAEMEAWIRLNNATNPAHALPRFRN